MRTKWVQICKKSTKVERLIKKCIVTFTAFLNRTAGSASQCLKADMQRAYQKWLHCRGMKNAYIEKMIYVMPFWTFGIKEIDNVLQWIIILNAFLLFCWQSIRKICQKYYLNESLTKVFIIYYIYFWKSK